MFTQQRQSGMSAVSLVALICLGAFLAYSVILITPMYYTNYKLGKALESVGEKKVFTRAQSTGQITNSVRTALAKNFRVQSIDTALLQYVRVNRLDRDKVEVTIDYTLQKPYVSNLEIAAKFEQKKVLTSK